MLTACIRFLGTLVVAALCLAQPVPAQAQDLPGMVELDALSNLYGAVTFDHEMHLDAAEDCSVCHHHTTGTPVSDARCYKCHSGGEQMARQACRDCHLEEPFSAEVLKAQDESLTRYHLDKPGLKGAYHLNCMGCHKEMDGPLGCQDCHQRTDAGDAVFHSGPYAPKAEGAGHGH